MARLHAWIQFLCSGWDGLMLYRGKYTTGPDVPSIGELTGVILPSEAGAW
jgi:hypothetical protein